MNLRSRKIKGNKKSEHIQKRMGENQNKRGVYVENRISKNKLEGEDSKNEETATNNKRNKLIRS